MDVSLQYSSFIKFLNGTNIVFVLVGFLKLSTLSFMAINLILNNGNINNWLAKAVKYPIKIFTVLSINDWNLVCITF